MIEIWRQCVTSCGSTSKGAGHDYMAVGALRAGGVMREVRILFSAAGTAFTQCYLVLSGTPVADATSFAAATPLMGGDTVYRHLGKPGFPIGATAFQILNPAFPMAVKVESGSRWVQLAMARHPTQPISLTVTVIGFAKVEPNGAGVDDGLS